jgi:6-phosphogluconolactonase
MPGRRAAPHIHRATFTPDNRFLAISDLGKDTTESYLFHSVTGIDTSRVVAHAAAPGSGSRLRFTDGLVEEIVSVRTVPDRPRRAMKPPASEFRFSRKALAVTNRGYDSVAVIAIDNTGRFVLTKIVDWIGEGPTDMRSVEGTKSSL